MDFQIRSKLHTQPDSQPTDTIGLIQKVKTWTLKHAELISTPVTKRSLFLKKPSIIPPHPLPSVCRYPRTSLSSSHSLSMLAGAQKQHTFTPYTHKILHTQTLLLTPHRSLYLALWRGSWFTAEIWVSSHFWLPGFISVGGAGSISVKILSLSNFNFCSSG